MVPSLIKRLVGYLVASLITWMVLLALLQLLLRWLLRYSIPWADVQLRQMVLWVGMLGGVLAAAESRHIRIDLVEQYLSGGLKKVLKTVVALLSSAGSLFLTYLSAAFIRSEMGAGLTLKGGLFGFDVGQWVLELVIPFGFFLMGVFFLMEAFKRGAPKRGNTP